jgi:hypothetical protein
VVELNTEFARMEIAALVERVVSTASSIAFLHGSLTKRAEDNRPVSCTATRAEEL